MPRIELRDLLKPTTTPEQESFLTSFYAQFDNRSAANRYIINVEPIFYGGLIAGSEFLTYAADKLYLCYSITLNGTAFLSLTLSNILFRDENDASMVSSSDNYPVWHTTDVAPRFMCSTMVKYNFYFSRFTVQELVYLLFIGYRITLQ